MNVSGRMEDQKIALEQLRLHLISREVCVNDADTRKQKLYLKGGMGGQSSCSSVGQFFVT